MVKLSPRDLSEVDSLVRLRSAHSHHIVFGTGEFFMKHIITWTNTRLPWRLR